MPEGQPGRVPPQDRGDRGENLIKLKTKSAATARFVRGFGSQDESENSCDDKLGGHLRLARLYTPGNFRDSESATERDLCPETKIVKIPLDCDTGPG